MPATVIKIAAEIRTLPAGPHKLQLADILAHLASRDDPGQQAFQAVADALAQSLAETPVFDMGDQAPSPYLDLAKLIRYEHVTTTLDNPSLAEAIQKLVADDADVETADFTLKDCAGQLLGHLVRSLPSGNARPERPLLPFQVTGLGGPFPHQ